jgi:hypothetical protein
MTAIVRSADGTPLAVTVGVRTHFVLAGLLALAPLAARPAPAAADPLWQAEIHAGYGLALSGSSPQMSRRPTPLTITAIAAFAVNADPPLAGYGGLVVETLDRNAAGVVAGVELSPRGSHLHLNGGGIALVAPYTLWGATASAGACMHAASKIRLCADLQLTAYVGGSDLGEGHSVTQGQLVGGVVFDAP